MIAIRKTIALLLTAMLFALSAQAQDPVISERQIIEEALCTLEDYEVNGIVSRQDVKEEFLELFVSKDAPVFNDLMGIANGSELKASEYAQFQLDKIQSLEVKLANVRKERVYADNGVVRVELSADKSLSYFNNCELFFSTNDYYGTSYREVFTMVYNPNDSNRRCRIEKITGTIESSRTFPEHFYVFNRTSERDDKLMYVNGAGQKIPLKFNTYDQTFIEGRAGTENFYYPNADTKLIPIPDEDCHTLTMSYKPEKWRLKLHYDQPFGYYSASKDVDSLSHKYSGMELGLDIGYNVYATKKFKLGIYSGLGISNSSMSMTLRKINYAYDTYGEADIDEDAYTRHYTGMTGNEKVKTSNIVIPLYLEGDIRLHDRVSAILQFGVRNYLKISQSSSDFSLAADRVYGYYPQYDLTLDNKWGFNNFVNGAKWTKVTNSLEFNTYGLDVFGSVGLRVKIIPRLFADVLAGYQTTVVGGIDNSRATDNFVTYSCYGSSRGNDEVWSLLHGYNKVNRSHAKLSVALVWKF